MVNGVDPITLEVVRGYLVSTALQMRATLIRTAYAPILYETLDFSCGLMTADGELAAMSEDFSGHVFAMALGLDAARGKFEGNIHPGDVLAVNDPYTGGTHLNDIAFYTPFFVGGRLLFYIAVRAHHSDVGGATPGSFSGEDTEIYQEGMRIVPVKLIEEGRLNQGLWDVLFANMRLPEERAGDALAMLDTARVAEANLTELCERYGLDTVERSVDALLDSAEATMRACIATLPGGEYRYEHYMDNSGLSPEPLPLKLKLTVDGDTMAFDFTGSAPQVVGPMNCGLPVTFGGAFVVMKCWLDPKTPVNGGTFRPVRFVVPENSCLAAQLPAAVGGCWQVYRHLQTAAIGVFAQLMPHDLGGEPSGGTGHVYVGGYDEVRDRPYILYEYPNGGTPATSDTDGATGCFHYDGGDLAMVYSAESTEQRQPLLVESLAMCTDGEGAGYRRSGLGVIRKVRILSRSSQLNVMSDRAIIPPMGSGSAPSGSCNSITVIRDGSEIQPSPLPGKVKSFPLEFGDVLVMEGSGGGGVGDPLERELESVRREVFEGYMTEQRARDVYGVVIEDGEVDAERSRDLRRVLSEERTRFRVLEGPGDDFDDIGCRIAPMSPAVASRIGVGEGGMIEYVSGSTAPLRAWARIVADAPEDSVAIGPIGRSILRVAPGHEIWVRRLDIVAPAGSDVR